MENYDIIVIGAGHAGCEAAAASAKLGCKVLLITMDMTKMAFMSCNPAIGGVAKGQIVREIDALGGLSGIVTDESMIQFRMLNRSKGPAMWSPRAQCDRTIFTNRWREHLETIPSLFFWQDKVNEIIVANGKVIGVFTGMRVKFLCKSIILTSGTFENGKIFVGTTNFAGGRMSEANSNKISDVLEKHGIVKDRMKTGTPARIDGRSINFDKVEPQHGDSEGGKFSFTTGENIKSTHPCYITHTNQQVHDILKKGFEDSPLFSGTIHGRGPRYCPSIEDKIVTFAEKDSHQLFLEPEGKTTAEYYINGFSSSLPIDIQYNALKLVAGLENVRIFRPGYAIEYDYYPPIQLFHTLESKKIENLYFAGQVNGTTGYEEAAGQGLMAGINAAQKIRGEKEIILSRDQSYIGVLIDDLVLKGVDEPYRMFTSRAEHRILLRQDNADERLTPIGYNIGLISQEHFKRFTTKQQLKSKINQELEQTSVEPNTINKFLEANGTKGINQKIKAINIIKRPQIVLKEFYPYINSIEINSGISEILENIDIEIKYGGYIAREKQIAEKISRLKSLNMPDNIDYKKFKSISIEARQKLERIKPKTIAEASRIPGVSPSDINVLLVHFGR